MDNSIEKYFVTKDNIGFSVIYQGYSDEAGNFWATKKDGFETEEDAIKYAKRLNADQ